MVVMRPDVKAYFDAMASFDRPSIVDLDPVVARAMGKQAGPMVELPPREMARFDVNALTRGGGTLPVRIYNPLPKSDAAPVIVFYHGGGWVLGDVEGYDSLCSEMAHLTGMTLVSVDYRLAPEDKFPAAVEDSIDATQWVASGPPEIGHPVSTLIVAGDSAGGALAAVVAREWLDRPSVPIAAQWLIYPVTDLSKLYPSDIEFSPMLGLTDAGRETFYRHYLGDDLDTGMRHPHVSPLLGDRWAERPPTVILTCSLDPLRDQGRALAAKLVSEGVDVVACEAKGQVHGSFTMRKMLPSAQDDLERSARALGFLLARG